MKGDRLRVPVEPAYITALGLAVFAFAQLEWAAICCCERMAPNSINTGPIRTANYWAKQLKQLAAALPSSSTQIELCTAADEFTELVRKRKSLLHAQPGTADDGTQGLFRDGRFWTADMIDDAADAFTACNDRLVALLHGDLAGPP
ncbi:MAG TPA: hypothetical protein VNZ53_10870 [Steroidobacteraceae bacterium]|jgi:hypothetical protein|nr:hypothetical protein [Steroidobacteraceae bacterium]